MSALPRSAATGLACAQLNVEVAGRALVRELELSIAGGSVTAVLGCNGAGKTLTLHTLAGLRAPAHGSVTLEGELLASWPRRALARKLGLLTQTTEDPFPSTVLDSVLVGRHPHIDFWRWESDADRAIARTALAAVALEELAERDVDTLSGGERRRVALAALLAQNPAVFLLDEPINHLDPHHQIDVLKLLREKAQAGCTVVMSLHDAGLAARFSDYALLLFGNGEWLSGATTAVLTPETMTKLYGVAVREISWAGGRTFVAE
ncbi:MAG TPA: ABC transporter ATP-binding protein [Steroidobacteraceae bacterium]|jgi:iron complex transport system ATP-binding protein|nr:ABC transporter ATP-binding protein [Steroidobacteraceae bacterium]